MLDSHFSQVRQHSYLYQSYKSFKSARPLYEDLLKKELGLNLLHSELYDSKDHASGEDAASMKSMK